MHIYSAHLAVTAINILAYGATCFSFLRVFLFISSFDD